LTRAEQGEILPGFLYLGDRLTAGEADRLNALGITHVLNVTLDIPNFYEGKDVGKSERRLTYKRCGLKDRIDADIAEHFDGACDFITQARCAPLRARPPARRSHALCTSRHQPPPRAAPAHRVAPRRTTRRESGGRVLVHCRAGMSRSATMVIGYLMVSKRWPLKRALQHVDSCRFVQPNSGFMQFLINKEKEMFGTTSLTPQDLYPGPSGAGLGGPSDEGSSRPPPTGC
jgi:hypothetical protein